MILLKVVLRQYFEWHCREHWISLVSFTKDSSQTFINSTLAPKKVASYLFTALFASMLKPRKNTLGIRSIWFAGVGVDRGGDLGLIHSLWWKPGIPHTPQPSFRRQSCGASEESVREVVWEVFHLWNPPFPWSMWIYKANRLVLREEVSLWRRKPPWIFSWGNFYLCIWTKKNANTNEKESLDLAGSLAQTL